MNNNNHTTMVQYFIVSEKLGVLSTSRKKVVLGTGAILSKREKIKRSESLFICTKCRGFFSSALAQSPTGVQKQNRARVRREVRS